MNIQSWLIGNNVGILQTEIFFFVFFEKLHVQTTMLSKQYKFSGPQNAANVYINGQNA